MNKPASLSKEELDKQYFVRGLVPEWDSKLSEFSNLSSQKRKERKVFENIPYGDDKRQVLDIIMPKKLISGGSPVLLFFHGGYWRMMDKNQFSFIANAGDPSGAITVIPNYRLLPLNNFDDINQDSKNALEWVFNNIQLYGGDPNKVIVCGHSAGAQLAAQAVASCGRKVSSFVGISGIYDLAPIKNTFLNDIGFLNDRLIEKYSLKTANTSYLTSAVFSYGEHESDEFKRQSKEQNSNWIKSGLNTKSIEIKNSNHATIVEQLNNPKTTMQSIITKMLK